MPGEMNLDELTLVLTKQPRAKLAHTPTPIHWPENFSAHIGGQELWIKRDDLRGLEGGGNKTQPKCDLLHFAWTKDASPVYREVGNILLSHIMGAEIFLDETERPTEDQSPLVTLVPGLESCTNDGK